ncbi:fimbrial usher protein [Trabulsiella guamensis ATCC 49490]|uniref:Fimbrial usher protein n=1 Tax=Trabulsiella guamensis ATCC 49490 TaxID=1005994 RepID=A0A084ZP96_9ENTR|nr:outer membrane usher protein [Trabulsiella guamensis]KFB99290.1 fimbrial usher protein [Trabulsiella guamensis ATCC 49490]
MLIYLNKTNLKPLSIVTSLSLSMAPFYAASGGAQFNTEFLDINDRSKIDLNRFSQDDYVMPGTYDLVVQINKNELSEHSVTVYDSDDTPDVSHACITAELIQKIGIKEEYLKNLSWWHNNECASESSLSGMDVKVDLSTSSLNISMPKTYLEYVSDNWEPPSRWDNGIAGILLDYNISLQARQQTGMPDAYLFRGNGTTGGNIGAWRIRADWQSHMDNQNKGQSIDRRLEWSRFYAYRALPSLKARLIAGEDYLNSGLFDGFRFTGTSLASDDNMLPPGLRGYAPEVTGVARTNARVIISQQGRVLYETQVPSGPFRIQDLNDSVSGELDVRVEEQDGSVQQFKVSTASIPYLTRPGDWRYKVALGRPSDFRHKFNGPHFITGELSRGISNGWSLYGGALVAPSYGALSFGVGRDLLLFGAISFDVTQSRAKLKNESSHSSDGRSYRVSYSKTFDEIDSQVTFAGYRFSDKNYLSMSNWLEARNGGISAGRSKEMYTLTLNKRFRDSGLSLWFGYDHQTFWDRPSTNRYTATLSGDFDLWDWKRLNLSLSAYRSRYYGSNDDGVYLSMSIPLGERSRMSYNSTFSKDTADHRVGYYDRVNDTDSMQMSLDSYRDRIGANVFYNHRGDLADTSINAAYQAGRFASTTVSFTGGATLTKEGGAFHRGGITGGTRLLVDTSGVPDVPVKGYGSIIRSNRFGKAVLVDVNSYFRSRAIVAVDELDERTEATKAVVHSTLTDGAIGYRKFDVISGLKAMAMIRLADGSVPPFGSTVMNARKQETGVVGDEGNVFLVGINEGESMSVRWDGVVKCIITLPTPLPTDVLTRILLLPCIQSESMENK